MNREQTAAYQHYCEEKIKQMDECIDLADTISQRQTDGKTKREAVLQYCKRYELWERTVWYYLTCYQENRRVSLDEIPGSLFAADDEFLRQNILSYLPKLRQEALPDFKALLRFTGSFLDRMTYLCDWVLCSFLEKTQEQDSCSSAVYCADQLVEKLDRELLALCESVIINTIGVIEHSYETWLMEQVEI